MMHGRGVGYNLSTGRLLIDSQVGVDSRLVRANVSSITVGMSIEKITTERV
jgi:hypothetical protein